MDDERDRKRKKDKQRDDDEERKENRSKRPRSRSRSPARREDRDSRRKRRHSRSKSPDGQTDKPPKRDSNEVKKEVPERKNKDADMLNTRTGGAYIPPARLRMMQAQITDKASVAFQRLAWEALKKSIHGHINKINVGNIGIIIKELLRENIVRGRGLLCRSIIQAQAASPTFTNVYAALVAAVNSRFPNIGELLLKRLVIQFKRGFKRNDKPICISAASFIAHLVNQRVAHEILALELLTLLVETPTDDSVEVAIAFLKECGQKLTEVSSKGVNAIFEMLRNILHEGQLDKRVQYMIEVMFQVWKDGFKDHPALIEELELVPEEDQFTHLLMLDDATDAQDILNVFKFDDKYEENEQKYKDLSKEILGSDAESGEEGSGSESGSEEDDEDEEAEAKPVTIIDNTETNLIALRRTIYLTINSSLDFEECAHKLMKMQLKPGQEVELCHMFLDCCAEQRTYEKFYGLLAQRFCNINRIYIGPFEEIFKDSYATAHRLDTNRLRNVSKFFAHLLITDSISWEVLECVKLNEEDTTSSSRIYIKILFQELAEYMGLKKLNDRLKDPTLGGALAGVFPRGCPRSSRFSINFFTSIGLGGLTDELREHLKQMPKNVPPAITEIKVDSESSSDSSSSSSDSSSSDSDSEEEGNEKSKDKDKSKSKDKKEDSPKPRTPIGEDNSNILKQAKERWGHDGFYDTYGKDAKRHEPRRERDDDNFVKPYPRDRRNDRSRDDRDGSDRRRDDRSYGDRRRNNDNREEERRRNNDGRDEEDKRDSRGRREEDSRKMNAEEPRDRSKDDRGKRSEDDGYDSRSRNDRESRNERSGDRYSSRNYKEGRSEVSDERQSRGDDREDKTIRSDERGSRRSERERPADKENDKYEKNKRSDDRNGRSNGKEDRKQNDREEQTNRTDERDDRRSRRHEDEGYESRSKRKDKDRSVEERRKESSDEKQSESDTEQIKEKKRSKKDKRKDKKSKDSSDDENDSDNEKRKKSKKSKKSKRKEDKSDSESSDGETEKQKKKTKKDKKKSRKENPNNWDIQNKEDLDIDTKISKRHSKKSKEMTEEWDIHRESSIKRDVSDRYWDEKRTRHTEDREMTPKDKERKRQG